MPQGRWLLGLLAGLAVVLTVAVLSRSLLSPPVQASQEGRRAVTELVLEQAPPELTSVDLHLPGPSHGDMLVFEAEVLGENNVSGTLRGVLLTTDIPGDADEAFEDRVGSLVFHLGGEDSIVVHGASVYPEQEVEMATEVEQLRAAIGGTGMYIGAQGQVTTTRNEDGTYTHRFELLE